MEKVLHFGLGKCQQQHINRHITLPPSYYSEGNASDDSKDSPTLGNQHPGQQGNQTKQSNKNGEKDSAVKDEIEGIQNGLLGQIQGQNDQNKENLYYRQNLKSSSIKPQNLQQLSVQKNDNQEKRNQPQQNVSQKSLIIPPKVNQNLQNQTQSATLKPKENEQKAYNPDQYVVENPIFKCLIFAPTVKETLFKRHLILIYRGLVYAKKCLKGPSDKYILSKQVKIPKTKDKREKTLLLDLDETLIHSCTQKENPEYYIKAKSDLGEETILGINMRPYCREFLKEMRKLFEIIIFTASSHCYANAVIKFIDPEKKYISGILSRQNCMETKNGFFIKDLRIIKERNLKDVVLVDNLAHSFGFQIDNGIPILEWHNDKSDQELRYLQNYLKELYLAEDVREFNKEKLKLNELAELDPEEVSVN